MKTKVVLDVPSVQAGRLIFMRNYFSKSISLAPVPYLMSILGIDQTILRQVANLAVISLGVAVLSLLAQVKILLPWTPVPVTGQTFGVLLLSLLLGRSRSFLTVASYLALGIAGFSVFASANLFGPTAGYLAGMLVASFVVGWLSDRGWNSRFSHCLAAGLISSTIIFSFGLYWLSFFVPGEALLQAGLIPFLPGDILKTTLAAILVAPVGKGIRRI